MTLPDSMTAPTLRAVFFDLDDTLFDHRHCARTALMGVRDAHACFAAMEFERFETAHATVLETLHLEVMRGSIGLDAARIERFRRLYEQAGHMASPDLAARTAAQYRAGYLGARRAVRGARDLLADVQRFARVVIVSNNLLDEQQEKLRHCGLAGYVDLLVVSEEAGVSKPEPGIFEIALARAECTASEAVMVGDSWRNDIEGARGVGIRPIWFNPDGADAPDPSVAVLRALTPLTDALNVIRGDHPVPTIRRERA